MLLLDGKAAQRSLAQALSSRIKGLSIRPTLAIIQIGALAESTAYIRQKKLFGEKIGVSVLHLTFSDSVGEEELTVKIKELNRDKEVHGILVQLPIPERLSKEKIINAISPDKDVDGLTGTNARLLASGKTDGLIPATARGIADLLHFYRIPIRGKRIAVLGRSELVGRPTALLLLLEGGRVTVCHSQTLNTKEITRGSDIIVIAIGKPKYLTRDFVSAGQVVIDVGINSVKGEKFEEELPKRNVVGDVDFDAVKGTVSAISPVPGGVGPMTVAALFENLLEACERQQS